jgi:hypothetical protein
MLTDETIRAQYFRSVPPALITRLLGFDVPGIRSALLFLFRAPAGGVMDHADEYLFPAAYRSSPPFGQAPQPKGQRAACTASPRACGRSPRGSGRSGSSSAKRRRSPWRSSACLRSGSAESRAGTAGIPDAARRLRCDLTARSEVEVVPDGDYQDNPNVHRDHSARRCPRSPWRPASCGDPTPWSCPDETHDRGESGCDDYVDNPGVKPATKG